MVSWAYGVSATVKGDFEFGDGVVSDTTVKVQDIINTAIHFGTTTLAKILKSLKVGQSQSFTSSQYLLKKKQ
jgi:hypothetical protein